MLPWLSAFPSLAGALGAAFAVVIQASVASAAPGHSSATRLPARSILEDSLVQEALAEVGWEEDPSPWGKTIESVEVYVFRVFDHRDPVPNFVNVFHARTRKWVVEQEVLPRVGEKYDVERILETERNLRSLRQLSIGNVVAAKGSSEDTIRLLVVVKDVWSLRLNSDWAYGSSGLDLLILNPTEENLGGIRASLGGLFMLQRHRYVLGGGFTYPRLLGLPHQLSVGAGTIQNRFGEGNEGGYGTFSFSLPLYSRLSKWGYGVSADFIMETTRKYRDGDIDQVTIQRADGSLETIPWTYESESFEANYWGVRSFGFLHKVNLWFGLEMARRNYHVRYDATIESDVRDVFEDYALPASDQQISPYVTLALAKTRYHRVQDMETLGILEDFRLGYGVSTTVFVAAEALGSSRDLVGTSVSLGYTIPLGDGLVRVGGSNRIVVANQDRHEGFVDASARVASPRFVLGRLHLDGYVGHRYQDYLNVSPFRLGGNGRLRGYPASSFVGKNVAAFNAELRTAGVDILSAQVGLAAFYDLGAAMDVFSEAEFHQGTGLGVRILFPQAERTVLRFDWGLPVSGDRDVLPGAFFFTFGQAFAMPDSSGG